MSLPYDLHPWSWLDRNRDCLAPEQDLFWEGNVFMNPPYSRAAGTAWPFVKKLCEKYDAGLVDQAIVVVNSSTATKYFQALAARAKGRCDCSPRINFEKAVRHPKGKPDLAGQTYYYDREPQNQPRYDNTIFYLAPHENYDAELAMFMREFRQFGGVSQILRHEEGL